jgi:hemerythrin superfamily protein
MSDAIEFLISQHNAFRKTLKTIVEGKARPKTFSKLLHDLKVHEDMEQKVWYPALPQEHQTIIRHLLKEEAGAAKLIGSFSRVKTDKTWWAKFAKLHKDVLHHAMEEETKLFPKVKLTMSKTALRTLATEMRRFKRLRS